MRTSESVVRSLAIAFAVILSACGDSPTTPPPTGGGPSNPSTIVRGVEISGPREVAPSSTQQFRATARFEDGSSRDVTDEAQWLSSSAGVFTVTRGLVTAGPTVGHTNLHVSFGGWPAQSEVIVVPSGTFRVMGVVTEIAATGYKVADALVEAATPSGVLSTRTLSNGEYRLYGVAGSTEIRVTKSGYEPLVRSINVAAHDRFDLEIGPDSTRPRLAGTYTLTITADDACRSQLPDDVLSRTYSAIITENGPRLTVTLQGGTFANEAGGIRDRFLGSVDTGRPEFQLNTGYDECFSGPSHECFWAADVLEALGPARYFSPTGKVVAIESGSTISGALDGTIYERGQQIDRYPVTSSCKSSTHRFTLRK